MSEYNTPILFLIFNRPEQTRKVFSAIRAARPQKLFVAADGPRNKEELSLCLETRKIVQDNIDWDCEFKLLFRDSNIGCGKAIPSAISWFFEQVEEGIILEDDCLPSSSFFPFCEAMLRKFRNDTRVMMVSGLNVFGKWQEDERDYFFSQGGIWGWATWKRAWELHDHYISLIDESDSLYAIENALVSSKVAPLRMTQFKQSQQGIIDTWDYQWLFTRLINSGLSVNPAKNLVTNIGFGSSATHTVAQKTFPQVDNLFELQFPLRDNPFIILDKEYERRVAITLKTPPRSFCGRLWLRVKHIIKICIRRQSIL